MYRGDLNVSECLNKYSDIALLKGRISQTCYKTEILPQFYKRKVKERVNFKVG